MRNVLAEVVAALVVAAMAAVLLAVVAVCGAGMTIAVTMLLNAVVVVFLCARTASRLDGPPAAALEVLAVLLGTASAAVAVLALAV